MEYLAEQRFEDEVRTGGIHIYGIMSPISIPSIPGQIPERSLVFSKNKEEAAKLDFLFRNLCRRTERNSSFLDPTVAEIAEQRNK